MATTPKKKATVGTTYTHTNATPFDPFAAPQFTTGNVQTPATVTRPPSVFSSADDGRGYVSLAKNANIPGVPVSYVDDVAQEWQGHQPPGGDPAMTQDQFNMLVKQRWDSENIATKNKYTTQDSTASAGINTANAQGAYTQSILGGPAQDAAYANRAWEPVTAATNRATAAQAAQVTGDRAAEQELNGRIGEYTSTLDRNQADRMADIGATNAGDTQDSQDFMRETLAANQRNTGFANQWTDSANSTNALQTQGFNKFSGQMDALNARQDQLFNTFSGQMGDINANQTGLYNNFMGDIASANAQQNQNLSQFGGAVSSANSQSGAILNQFGSAVNTANNNQNQIVAQYSQQLSQMNEQDKAAYLQYLNETNPLMAQMIAQASNPQYVANQQDAVQQFKNNYNPEVTDQERFLSELARRKFEGDDKASRDAVMQQLETRGLRSGGLTIANQQATQQQLAQDRQMNELGLNANAVERAERNRVDYSNASNSLRNADDAMRNFQDQYAQNDAVRRGNLAQQRNQQGLNTTGQVTARDTANYNARTQSNQLNYGRAQDYYSASRQTNNDIYGRNLDYYNAGTETVNNNFSRTQAGYDAGSQTNRDNATRDLWTMNAGTDTNTTDQSRDQAVFTGLGETNRDNSKRTTDALVNQEWVNQGNLGNYQNAISGPAGTMTVRDANSTRTQGGIDKGDLSAGSKLGAQVGGIQFKTGNLQTEQQNATNWAPTAASIAGQGITTQRTITKEQQDALAALLGLGNADQKLAIAKQG